ncbi:MAG: hypothetical protein HGA87_03880 [Desulfobulbaceae bacterium]|nr:hypothetical protein [Desulfobulbaceae bacterium]
MIDIFKTICMSIVLGVVLIVLSLVLDSDFIFGFLSKDLISLLVALMAINTTTMGVIMGKLKEIADQQDVDFSSTIKEMKVSVYEQVVLIIVAILLLVLKRSNLILQSNKSWEVVIWAGLAATFVYAIYILFDTAKGIFVLLENRVRSSTN